MRTTDYYTKKSFVKRKDGTTAQMVWECNFCEFETTSFWFAIKHARKHKKEIDEMTLKENTRKDYLREGYIPCPDEVEK